MLKELRKNDFTGALKYKEENFVFAEDYFSLFFIFFHSFMNFNFFNIVISFCFFVWMNFSRKKIFILLQEQHKQLKCYILQRFFSGSAWLPKIYFDKSITLLLLRHLALFIVLSILKAKNKELFVILPPVDLENCHWKQTCFLNCFHH